MGKNIFETFQIKGDDGAVGFYKLLLRLVASKPLSFFKEHQKYLCHLNEKPLPTSNKSSKSDVILLDKPIQGL